VLKSEAQLVAFPVPPVFTVVGVLVSVVMQVTPLAEVSQVFKPVIVLVVIHVRRS